MIVKRIHCIDTCSRPSAPAKHDPLDCPAPNQVRSHSQRDVAVVDIPNRARLTMIWQHLMIGHWRMSRLKKPHADEVDPSRRYHGLRPSLDLVWMIRRCWGK